VRCQIHKKARCSKANLSKRKLGGADLRQADLRRANMIGTPARRPRAVQRSPDER
jgi:uncharacterized protein YjbI with pentapeptide repeats